MVPVLYKISTVVDSDRKHLDLGVPVLYKISTVVDEFVVGAAADGSRSLQNFYCCRFRKSGSADERSRSLQNFYCCRSETQSARAPHVPVLYKISTVVDLRAPPGVRAVPVLYKISTVVDRGETLWFRVGSRSLQNFYCCRYGGVKVSGEVPVLYKISTVVDIVS